MARYIEKWFPDFQQSALVILDHGIVGLLYLSDGGAELRLLFCDRVEIAAQQNQ
jgi:hypothetical protein